VRLTEVVVLGWVVAISVLKDGKGRNHRFWSLSSSKKFSSFSLILYVTVDLLRKKKLMEGIKK